jgi:2-keto-4-pentenoate hydratase/2-oxohepta-3-ene-1,7-dioic acid hydratase in catechol pathway
MVFDHVAGCMVLVDLSARGDQPACSITADEVASEFSTGVWLPRLKTRDAAA